MMNLWTSTSQALKRTRRQNLGQGRATVIDQAHHLSKRTLTSPRSPIRRIARDLRVLLPQRHHRRARSHGMRRGRLLSPLYIRQHHPILLQDRLHHLDDRPHQVQEVNGRKRNHRLGWSRTIARSLMRLMITLEAMLERLLWGDCPA